MENSTPTGLSQNIQNGIRDLFPKSYLTTKVVVAWGRPMIIVKFALGAESDWDRTWFNDPVGQLIYVCLSDDMGNVIPDTCPGTMEVHEGVNLHIALKHWEKGRHSYNLPTGFVEFSGDANTIQESIVVYFGKLRSMILGNIEDMHSNHKQLAIRQLAA